MLRLMDEGARPVPNGTRAAAPMAALPPRAGAPVSPPGASTQPAGVPVADALMSRVVEAAGAELQNPRQLSDRIAMGRALWRELVIGFAGQLSELGLGFTQLAALYSIAGTVTLTVGELAIYLGRSPSATSRVVSGLEHRGLLVRNEEVADRRERTLALTDAGAALLGQVDRARAEQFLAVVRPLPAAERALVAMGVAALADRAITRRGKLIKAPPGE
jgi:DNA-binding MarR family transcriptional regulator